MGPNVQGTLRSIANELIQDMVNQISAEDKVASGTLRNSFKSEPTKQGIGIKNEARSAEGYNYSSNVDLGRSPGKYVPIRPLVRWASIRSIVPKNNRSLTQFAFAVSKTLMARGYQGINFSAKSFLKSQDMITRRIGDAYLKDLEEELEREIPNLK
jgi:hypothetical protein